MANTLALRRRIKTAQNVSKTTRAMQMIAASKLKRAQNAALSGRPYVDKLIEIVQSLSESLQSEKNLDDTHPYMQKKTLTGKTLYVIVSPDKGLCGGLVTNLIREYFKFRKDDKSLFLTIGKKTGGAVAASQKHLVASFPFGLTVPEFSQVLPVVQIINDYFLGKKVDSVKLVTTHFIIVFSQAPKIIDLLPISLEVAEKVEKKVKKDMLFEPAQEQLLPELLKRYIDMTIFQNMLESYASENAARM